MIGITINRISADSVSFGGMSTKVAAVVAVGVVAAIAGASAAIGAARIDQLDRSSGTAELVAGVALVASAVLVAVVALTRTRLAVQEAEIELLRERVLDAELRSEPGVGEDESEDEWENRVLAARDAAADGFVLRCSER